MGYVADCSRRFYHPAATESMLEAFLPLFNGTNLDVGLSGITFKVTQTFTSIQSTLASQYYLLTFLPQSHPQLYLKLLFQLWEGINSYIFDERMLAFLSQLAEMHVDPSLSDPNSIKNLPDDARSSDESRPEWKLCNDRPAHWEGLYSDVGIFGQAEWNLLMCKCLASMGKLSLAWFDKGFD